MFQEKGQYLLSQMFNLSVRNTRGNLVQHAEKLRTGDNISFVAVTIIERILYDCKHDDECEEEFPLNKIEKYEKVWKLRVVACPNPRCFTMVPLSQILAHLETSHHCTANTSVIF